MTGATEGSVPVPGGNVWYGIEGAGSPGVPLLVLHGGPGAGHDYLEPVAALSDERPVVFYDQLGCGKSDIPDDTSLWRVDRFVEEVAAVRRGLGLDRVHLLGQSWGGWLALEYMLTRPAGVAGLILADTSASVEEFAFEARAKVAELPAELRDTIERCEESGATDSAEYAEATLAYYQHHLCRVQPWPGFMLRTMANVQASPLYNLMWGPSEFNLTGTLKGWDVRDRLGEIDAPTLILNGRYDEAGPTCWKTLHAGIAGSELHIFEDSSHSPHVEEPAEYQRVVRDFLRRAEPA